MSYIEVPIVEVRELKRLASASVASPAAGCGQGDCGRGHGRGHGRGRGRARGRPRRKSMSVLRKSGALAKAVVKKKWPVFSPANMAKALQTGGAEFLLSLVRFLYVMDFVA